MLLTLNIASHGTKLLKLFKAVRCVWSDGVCVCSAEGVNTNTDRLSHPFSCLTHLTHTHLLSTVWIIDWHKPYHNKPNMASECILCLNACFHLLVCTNAFKSSTWWKHWNNSKKCTQTALGHWISTGSESNYNQAWCDYAEFSTNAGLLTAHWKSFPLFFVQGPACSLILVCTLYVCKYIRQDLETIRHIAKASGAEASPAKLFLILITVKHLNSTTDGLAC